MHPQILIPVAFAIFLGGGVVGFILKSRLIAAKQKVAGAFKNSAQRAEQKAADELGEIRKKL